MKQSTKTTNRAFMHNNIPYRYCYEEGGMIEIEKDIYTGSYEIKEGKKLFTSVKGSSRYILRDGTGIYVFDKADTQYITDKDKPGYRYSNNIEAITVSINEKCKTNVDDSEVITQPVMLDVYIKATHNDTSRFENKTITLRNKIQSLEVNGELYQIGSNGSQLVHVEK